MAWWRDGDMAWWRHGVMAWWRHGVMATWRHGAVKVEVVGIRDGGVVVEWCEHLTANSPATTAQEVRHTHRSRQLGILMPYYHHAAVAHIGHLGRKQLWGRWGRWGR